MSLDELGYQGVTDRVLSEFSQLLNIMPDQIEQVGVTLPIPTFDEQTMIDLSKSAMQSFASDKPFIKVDMPLYIVGDIHGNIFDLIRVLVLSGKQPNSRFLFLGDYVDRGQYSIECVALLFALRIRYSDRVFLLRGNHEFANINAVYGFKEECENMYRSLDAYNSINDAFGWMPLAAKVGNSIFAVHGGISPQIASFRQLRHISRPITTYENSIACDLLWSDPTTDTKEYIRSTRGNGVTFGKVAVKEFLKHLKVKHIVRAHQCVQLGVEKFAGDKVYTVFSCSNYIDNSSGNRAGLLFIGDDNNIEMFSLPPINQIPRNESKLTGTGIIINQTKSESVIPRFNKGSILTLNYVMQPKTYMTKKAILTKSRSLSSFSSNPQITKVVLK